MAFEIKKEKDNLFKRMLEELANHLEKNVMVLYILHYNF